jgi:ATP adenylyltransferase
MEYVVSPKTSGQCVFCGVHHASSDERRGRLVVCRNERAFVMLNRYPFTAGHLLVVPHRHVDSLEALDRETCDALFALVREAAVRLRRAVRAEGLNIGVNLGEVAGAGIAEHLHAHIVPRWGGDTNFLPVLAQTRVVPQALDETLTTLVPFFADLDVNDTVPPRPPHVV